MHVKGSEWLRDHCGVGGRKTVKARGQKKCIKIMSP